MYMIIDQIPVVAVEKIENLSDIFFKLV